LAEPAEVGASIAYFSMEVGIESSVPTYAGGLGVLAGDTLRAAADLGIPMAAISLVHRKGYFRQRLSEAGEQIEVADEWSPESRLEPLAARVGIDIEGHRVQIRAWLMRVRGRTGFEVPLYLLDTNLPENEPADRELTDRLYGGDERYRLAQEAVLGLGGVAMLEAIGHTRIRVYHLNEGHSALLALRLLEIGGSPAEVGGSSAEDWPAPADVEAVRRRCVFTTHTPVPAGHDRFPIALVREVLGEARTDALERIGCCPAGELNMTHLALQLSGFLNGVAMRHRQVSRGMFPGYPVDSITNGVHVGTWLAPSFQALFDREIPEWRREAFNLRYAVGVPLADIRHAHEQAQRALFDEVERQTGRRFDPAVLTLGFARRAAPYKRADLLFSDVDRLLHIDREVGALQVLYAGKAHPRDDRGKIIIQRVIEAAHTLADRVPIVYLEDYDMALAAKLCAGVDVWLNTPLRPQEASGTSGMKAALNGVPSLSVIDGWWVEGHVEGVTGWAIGDAAADSDPARDAGSLYDKLEHEIAPMYYGRPDAFAQVMRSAIALNGSFFHSERMLFQYARHAYQLTPAHTVQAQ